MANVSAFFPSMKSQYPMMAQCSISAAITVTKPIKAVTPESVSANGRYYTSNSTNIKTNTIMKILILQGFVSAKIDEQKTEETKQKVIALVGKI